MTSLSQRLNAIRPVLATKAAPPRVIEFGAWMPDQPDFANPGALTALNVIPRHRSYGPFPDLSAQSTALDAKCFGAISARDSDNNVFVYAGDASKLYEMTDLAFTDQSVGGGYSLASNDVWEFVLFNEIIIATNFTDAVQSIAVGGGGAGAFADLITSTLKPKAKHAAVIGNFLVFGNTSDATDGHKPNRVWWSAIGDQADFDPDADTQCDLEDLKAGGWVQKVVGGRHFGLVFTEEIIYRMSYVGSPVVFDIHAVDDKRGTPIPNSVVSYGGAVFYIAREGFMQTFGAESVPIGDGMVDREFWDQFDISNRRNVSAAVDPKNKLVIWSFPGTDSVAGEPNKLFLYHWPSKRWTPVDLNVELLLSTQSQGFTLEGLDSLSTDIDDGTLESFDSDLYKGGDFRFGAFDTDHKLGFFLGDNLAATIDTGEYQPFSGRRGYVRRLRPLVDGGTVTVKTATRNRLTDTATFGSAVSLDTDGSASVSAEGRYHRQRIDIAAGGTWTHAQGIEVEESAPLGSR